MALLFFSFSFFAELPECSEFFRFSALSLTNFFRFSIALLTCSSSVATSLSMLFQKIIEFFHKILNLMSFFTKIHGLWFYSPSPQEIPDPSLQSI